MMNLTSIQHPENFEVDITSEGKQVFGYLGLINSSLGYPYGDYHYISVDTLNGLNQSYQVDRTTYQSIKSQLEDLNTMGHEYLYLWLEISSQNNVNNWKLFKLPMLLEEVHSIYQASYHFESLYQLINLIYRVRTQSLQKFLWMVFQNHSLMQKFVSIPASKRHHHSFPGGLLAHSLECAFITHKNIEGMHELTDAEKEVTLVAAILHDIGKTETLSEYQHTPTGQLLDHEQLTLMVLADPLRQLNKVWPRGAQSLQYLLTWKHSMGYCRYVGGNVIKLADHLSTSASLRLMAFKDKPDYYHFSVLKTGQQSHYINRLV